LTAAGVDEEIERKFLVNTAEIKKLLASDIVSKNYTELDQGYLVNGPTALRLRIAFPPKGPHTGELTIKGPGAVKHYEKNVELPEDVARALQRACPGVISKHRFRYGRWEIDRFINVNDPDTHERLWMAEIELKSEEEAFEHPSWLGREVTLDLRYTNARLSEHIVKD